jgi:hypothetical protein
MGKYSDTRELDLLINPTFWLIHPAVIISIVLNTFIYQKQRKIEREDQNQRSKQGTQYGKDFTHGFDTQNYPKLQASLGTQPENTHGIQNQTQPNPYPWIFSGRVG